MHTLFILLVLLPLCLSQRPGRCGSQCRYAMCNNDGRRVFPVPLSPFVLFAGPLEASGFFPCRRDNSPIIAVTSVGEAQVRAGNRFINISWWRPPGLRSAFPADTIQPVRFRNSQVTGFGRRLLNANQWRFLHDQCMIIPIKEVTIKKGNTIQTLKVKGEDECVAIRTTAPQLHFQLIWDSPGDGDLVVQQPDGDVVDFLNLRSEEGRLTGDNGVGLCRSSLPGYTENVVYFRGKPKRGRYRVEGWESKGCGSRTNVELRVISEGVVRKSIKTSAPGGLVYRRVAKQLFTF